MTDITFVLRAKNEAKRATKEFGDAVRRGARGTKEIEKNARRAARQTDKLSREAREAAKGYQRAAGQARKLAGVIRTIGGLVGGIAIGAALRQTIIDARGFNAALAETSTLIEGTPEQLRQLEAAASDLVKTYGGTAQQQIEAFYQTISAGVSDISDATVLLEQANKLAVGGVTDTTTAVDILTTAVNAYGPGVLSAAEASDSLFTAVRLGKTTVPELARTLGRVIPIAKTAGVNFDELNATVAALTSQGIATAEAVTGVRGVLAAIVKPTSEAAKQAEALGINFSSAGVAAAGGLIPFLEEIIDKTNGNTEALAQLFTGVEGLIPVLSLAGGGIDTVGQNLEEFANKLGATDEAYAKVAANLDRRLSDAVSSIREDFRALGQALLRILTPAVEALAAAISFLSDNLGIALAALAGVVRVVFSLIGGLGSLLGILPGVTTASAALGVAFKGIAAVILRLTPVGWAIALASAISALTNVTFEWNGATVSVGQVVSNLVNTLRSTLIPLFGAIRTGVTNLIQGFRDAAGGINISMSEIVDFVINGIDRIIQLFVGLPRAIGAALSNLPSVLRSAFGAAMNAAIDVVARGINNILEKIRGLFAAIDGITGGGLAARIGNVDLDQFKFTVDEDAFATATSAVVDAFESGGGILTGAADQAARSVKTAAEDLAFAQTVLPSAGPEVTEPLSVATPTGSTTSPAGASAGGGGGGGGAATSALSDTINQIIGKYQELADTAGLTAREIEEYQIKQQLLNAAQQDGIELSPQVVESVLAQKRALEEAAAANETFQAGIKRGYEEFVDSLQTSAEFASDFTQNAIKGFTDLITDFVTTGKADFRGLIVDLLKQIASFLANRLVVDFLGVAGGGTGGKGTLDFLGGLFGGFGGGRAEGGPVQAGRSYLVGEAGPELFTPRQSGGIATANDTEELVTRAGAGMAPINVSFNITTPDADSFRRNESQIRARMSRVIAEADRRNN